MDTERQPCQKIILCLLAAMAVLFAVWTAVSRTHEGVAFQETLLTIHEENGQTVYSGNLYSTPFTITCREENGTTHVDFDAPGHYTAHCRVEFPEGTITTEFGKSVPRVRILRDEELLFSGGYDPAPDSSALKFCSEDGSWEPAVSIGFMGNGDPWHYFEFSAWEIFDFATGQETSVRGSWRMYLMALFLTVIGALLIAFPETTFYLSHCLDVRDPEPTDFYYFTHKVSSVLLTGIILVLYCIGIFAIV